MGSAPERLIHTNTTLFVPVALLRWLQHAGLLRGADKRVGTASMPPAWLNAALLRMFRFELRHISPHVPVGIGVFLHLRKPVGTAVRRAATVDMREGVPA